MIPAKTSQRPSRGLRLTSEGLVFLFFFSVLIFSGILSHEAIKLTSCALGVNKTAHITINVSHLTHLILRFKKLIKRQVVSASVEFWQDIFCFCFYRTFVQKHKILHLGS